MIIVGMVACGEGWETVSNNLFTCEKTSTYLRGQNTALHQPAVKADETA